MKQIDAKPRRYKGTLFRSTLEADWAATLDHYGMTWEYEPEKLTLTTGEWYVPDFWLPLHKTVIEVKGTGVPRIEKAQQLARELLPGALMLIGLSPARRSHADYLWESHTLWIDANGYDCRLGRCPSCSAWQWLRIQITRRCRFCDARMTGLLAKPGEVRFQSAPSDDSWIDLL